MYHATCAVRARGVAILFRKGTPFTHKTTIADRDGRFLILVGELYSLPITLVNIYGPNLDSPSFFRHVVSQIPDISHTNLFIAGDMNLVLDPYLDRSSNRRAPSSKSSLFLKEFLKNSNIFDVWRIFHPQERAYSFHSNVHNVYTRIDYCLADSKLISLIDKVTYHDITISDHAPVSVSLKLNDLPKRDRMWRLDPQLLKEPEFCTYIGSQITFFLEMNDLPETSPSVLWETLKAYVRGCIISFQAERKRRRRQELTELEKQINKMDRENALHPSIDKHKKILSLRYRYNQILSDCIAKAFLFTQQKYFEFGEKPHKLLARQLRKMESDRTITQLKSNQGDILVSYKDINQRFQKFYEDLYSSTTVDCSTMNTFLDSCDLPTLEKTDQDFLNAELSVEEIQETIKLLKNSKTPGPDGFPNEFYKKFSDLISPYLLRMYTQAKEDGTLPPSLNEAIITVLPKKGKDPMEVSNYRPISLLTSDQKILAKTLSLRLNSLIGKLVHPDQTGFIPNRHSFFNLRRLFNIIYSQKKESPDLVILSLDAQKAFDKLLWPYLFSVLEKYNIGNDFKKWLMVLYDRPSARILTNGILSPPFLLHRGTRQGCALSPLLFALAIEPLAQKIRSEARIHGYDLNNTLNKISLYADDVLLYVTKPLSSIPVILDLISHFGSFSGYTINWLKSELMPIKTNNLTALQGFPFKISLQEFTYLGIKVTKDCQSLYKHNFPPLISKLQNNIEFWKSLPISLAGRINAIKMVFLPQILYLFQNIPIFLPKKFFKKVDTLITPFLWDNKTPRIKKTHLCRHKLDGGMGLPDFFTYYQACAFRIVIMWLDHTFTDPTWIVMERADCAPYDIGTLVLSPTKIQKACYSHNFIIHNGIRIWQQIKSRFNAKSLSFSLPIAKNPSFPPSCMDTAFSQWRELGILNIGNLFINNNFASFSQLQSQYGLHKNNFFRYLQVRDYVKKHVPKLDSVEPTTLDVLFIFQGRARHLISTLYSALLSRSSPSTQGIKTLWEEEFGEGISEELWDDALENIHKCSANSRHCLIQFKIIHRLHFSKTKLHKIFPEVSPLCDKCMADEASLLHSYFLCPKILPFWVQIFKTISDMLETLLEPDPILVVLGVSDKFNLLPVFQRKLLSYMLIIAKKLLLQFWKKSEIPSVKMWLDEMIRLLHLERIRYVLSDRLEKFEEIWYPLLQHIH